MFSSTAASSLLKLRSAIIRDPLVVGPDTPVIDAVVRMSDLPPLRTLTNTADRQQSELHLITRSSCVIVVEGGCVVGILTERDVVHLASQQQSLTGLVIRQVMTPPTATLRESEFTDLSFVITLLEQNRTHHLLILNEADYPVGLVTYDSLQQAVMHHQLLAEQAARQAAELRLQENEARYSSLLTAAPVGIFRTDASGRCVYVNEQYRQITGGAPEDLIGERWDLSCHPDDRDRVIAEWERSVQARHPFQLEYRCQNSDRAYGWVYVQAVPEFDLEGQVSSYVGTLTDISERKQAELALEKSELTNRTLVEALPDLLVQMDREGNFSRRAGGSAMRIKSSQASSLRPDVYKFLPQHLAEQQLCYVHQALESGLLQVYEHVLDYEDEPRNEEVRVAPLNDQEVLIIIRDITEHKQTEHRLAASESKFRSIFDHAAVGIAQGSLQAAIQSPNPRLCQMLGYTEAELAQLTFAAILHPDDRTLPDLSRLIAGEISHFSVEKRCLRKDNEFMWSNVTFSLIRDKAGNPLNFIAVIQDIHDRKRAEAALEEREQRFRQLFEATPKISVQGYDRHHRLIYWNDASEALYGYTRAEAIGQTLEDLIIPVEIRPWVNEVVETWMSGGPPIPAGELNLMRKGGSRVAVFSSHIMLTNPAGEPEMYCVDIDLSELKQTEMALQKSEARWQFALEGTGDGVWDWNVQTNTVFFSRQWKSMLGYAEHEVGDRIQEWADRIHPDDKAECYAELDKYFNGETTYYQFEFRLRCKNDSYKWILTRGKVVECTADGQPLRMIGTHKDISDRKQTELALHALIEGTAATTGKDFFPALASHIAAALDVSYAMVTERIGNELNTLAVWARGEFRPNFSFNWSETPCQNVLQAGEFYCEDSLQQSFPNHSLIAEMGVESYFGIALQNAEGEAIGTLCILSHVPISNPQWAKQILSVFAARAAAELERQRVSTQLEQLNQRLGSEVENRTAELCASETQIRTIVEAIPDLLLRVTRTGTCLEAIQSRYQAGEFLAVPQHLSDVLSPALLQQQMDRIEAAITTGTLQVYEHQLEKHGRLVYEEIRISALNNDEVLIIVRDITDRKQVENALQESQQFIQAVLETIPIPVFWKDRNSVFLGSNQPFAHALGVQSAAELIGKTDFDFAATCNSAAQYRADDQWVMSSGEAKLSIEESIGSPAGEQRWLDTHKAPLRDWAGNIIGIVGTSQDITDRKKAAEQLCKSEAALAEAQRVAHVGSWEFDVQGQKLTWSRELFRMFGLEPTQPEPTYATYLEHLVHPDDRALLEQSMGQAIAEGTPYTIDYRIFHTDGSLHHHEGRAEIERDAQGRVVRLFGTALDITDRKQAEAELEARQTYYQSIISDQTELICRFLPDGTFTFVNDAYCQFFQKSREELLGHSFHPSIPDEDKNIIAQHANTLSVDNSVVTYEHRVIKPDGAIAWQQWTERAMFDSDGNFLEFQAVGRDITALKEAEEALRESEQRLRRAIEDAPVPIMLHVEDGEVLQVNTTWTDLTGYTHQELPTVQDWARLAYGDRAEDILATRIARIYNFESRQDEGELSITKKDGSPCIWQFSSAPLGLLPDGRRVVISIAADMTQRRQAEAALRESEARLNLAVESAAIGIWDWNITANTLVWDERMYELYGITSDRFANVYEAWFGSLHPDDRAAAQTASTQALQGEQDYDTEFRVVHPDGHIRYIKANALVRRNALGEPQRMIGINYDITGRKETEFAMRQQLAAMEAAIDGIAILRGETFIYVNQAKLTMLGYEHPDELIGHSWRPLYSLDEPGRYEQEIRPALERYRSWEGEVLAIRKDGSTFFEELSLTITEDGLLICVCRDISERKRAETELEASRAYYRGIIADQTELICRFLPNGILTFVNDAYCNFFQKSSAELIGQSFTPLLPDEDTSIVKQHFESLSRENPVVTYEHRVIAPDGTVCWQQWTDRALFDSEGNFLEFQSVGRDVTALKDAEAKVRDLLGQTELLNHISSEIRDSLHLEIILQTSVDLIVSELPADICTFAWYQEDANSCRWQVVKEQKKAELPSWLGSHQLGNFPTLLEHILQNQPYQIDSLTTLEDEPLRVFLENAGITAYLCLPIHTIGGKVGSLQIGRITSKHPWQSEEIDLLKGIGDQLAIAIYQAHLYEESQAKTKELQLSYRELQETQLQLIQSEKMSSLGQLVAGIAHEINNPMSFIYGNLEPALEYAQSLAQLIRKYQEAYPNPPEAIAKFIKTADIAYILSDFPKLLASMETGATRIQDIIQSLRTFSRLDRAECKPVNLHENIDSTLVILQNRLNGRAGKPEIPVVKNYGDLPLVECYGSLLNQVFMNLLVNAIDAVEERQSNGDLAYSGCITITTTTVSENKVTVSIRDNGMGMMLATQAKIFNPFFTTKPVGVGTGMGLPISYQIVTGNHQGQLRFYSTPGAGTEFIVELWQSLHQLDMNG